MAVALDFKAPAPAVFLADFFADLEDDFADFLAAIICS